MVGDITYIATWQGWLFLATVIDCASRKVVGWAMDDNYKTPLISAAIEMAARNLSLPEGAIFHSDRGSNYTSAEFAGVLESLGIRQSVGRTGICYDNALAESFNGALKVERVHRTMYPTPAEGPGGHCTVHRDPLQSEPSPLRTWIPDPARGAGPVPEQSGGSIKIAQEMPVRKTRGSPGPQPRPRPRR